MNFFKKYKKTILTIVILPFILSIIAAYMIFGDIGEAIHKMWEYRGHPNKTAGSVTSLSYIITILVATYALGATTFFSFLVWKVSDLNLSVSQQLQGLEKNRDEELVRENALIVYYDLQRGISNLRDLYISCVLNGADCKPNRIYFSADWIKNVANLRNGLTNQELNRVYKLYEQFYALQNLLEEHKGDTQNEEVKGHIEGLTKNVIADFIPLSLLNQIEVTSVEDLIDIDFYITLQKIYALTYLTSETKINKRIENESVVYETYLKGSLFFTGDTKDLLVGNGTLYRVDGKVKCSGKFDLHQFVQGTVYGYYDSTKKFYEYTYESSLGNRYYSKGCLYELTNDNSIKYYYNGDFQDGKIINGITTLFDFNGDVSYKGEINDGQIEGQGTSYIGVGSPEFEGTWKNGNIINGIKFVSGNKVFEGEFRHGKTPWTGKAYDYDLSYTVKKFTGDIQDGKPVNGKGFSYNIDKEGKDLSDVEAYEEWLEETVQDDLMMEESEEYIEDRARQENDYVRRNSNYWVEYISAKWNEGIVTKAENHESNKRIYS